ncbi:MAG: MFS family permease [Halieaceae bacterium]|jgi:MFS family permease
MTRMDYGWWVLLGLFLVYMATNGILLNTLPLLYPELTREFGWNEEQVTRPASLLLLLTALLIPLLGALCDRFPARRIMLGGVILIVVPLSVFAYISSLTHMTLIYLTCSLGLTACGLVPCMLILSRWFVRRRGFAVGILLMGSSLGGAFFPLLAQQTLAEQGWREAITLIAAVGGGMMLLGLLLIRNRRPAGQADAESGAAATSEVAGTVVGYTLREAAALPAFYLMMIATGALWFCIVGVLQHQSIYLGQDLGVSNALLPLVFSAFFWSAVAGKLLFGYLGDHFNKVLILIASIINMLLGLMVLRAVDPSSNVTLLVYAIVFGVGFSGAFASIQLVLAEFFAGTSYGRILGIFIMVDSLAGAAGIQFLGLRRVADGSYLPALNMMIGMLVIVTLLVSVLLLFQPRAAPLAASAS